MCISLKQSPNFTPLPQCLKTSITSSTTSPFHLSASVLSRSALLGNCIMPKQSTTKRKAERPHHGPEALPTKKLQKASSQPALNSPPRPTSATDSSFSESPPLSLTSGSSIEDSTSSTANLFTDKSSASIASIESSSAPSAVGACSTSVLQETRPNHGGE